jgi:hypothetical protein
MHKETKFHERFVVPIVRKALSLLPGNRQQAVYRMADVVIRRMEAHFTPLPLEEVRRLEDLHPNPLHYERTAFMKCLRGFDREELREYYLNQPLDGADVFANYVVNLWEYEHGVSQLTSRPWNICIPLTEICNAKCAFCTSPLVPDPKATRAHEISHFSEALRYAIRVSLQGLGEPLAHPEFEAIAEQIKRYLNPVARLEMITNGWLLSGRRWELLKSIHISDLQVSVNAATDKTHQIAMGSKPGTFDQVVKNIETVLGDPGWLRFLKTSMVITKHSLPEVPRFLDLLAEKGVKIFQFNALLPLTSPDWGWGKSGQYVDLWCGHLPDAPKLVEEAKQAIARYRERGFLITATPDQWLIPVDQWRQSESVKPDAIEPKTGVSGPTEGPSNASSTTTEVAISEIQGPIKTSRIYCPMVYNTLSVFHHSFAMSICCYMENAPKYSQPNLKDGSLTKAYNHEGFRVVRESLLANEHIPVCKTCPYGDFRS